MIALAESGEHDPVNIGNPDEFTLLELAETVIQLTGSKSEIVFEALPTDDPKQRKPDISPANELPGWAAEIAVRGGLARTIAAPERRRRDVSRARGRLGWGREIALREGLERTIEQSGRAVLVGSSR